MLLFLKTQLVASFFIGFFIWNSTSTATEGNITVFNYDCEDGPEVRVSGEILSISAQNAEITQIREMGDHVRVSFHCLENASEGGITIIAVEDIGF